MERADSQTMPAVDLSQHVERLGSREWNVHRNAFDALRNEGSGALTALIEGLSHSNQRVRKGCADLMDHLADNRCVEPLVRLLQDPIEGVRRLALHALGCQGCKACPLDVDIVAHLVAGALTDHSIRVRRVAVHQLGCQSPDARAAAALHTILQKDTDSKILSRARWAIRQHQTAG